MLHPTRIRRSRALEAIPTLWALVAFPARSHTGMAQTEPAAALSAIERQIEQALARGANDQAAEELNALLASSDVADALLLCAGLAFAQRELYVPASRAFARCVRSHPEVFEGHYNLALAELAQNHGTEALAAIEAAPHRSEAEETARLYLRGKIEGSLGQTQRAIQDLSAAFERDPREENVALDLGLLHLRSQNYSQAPQVLRRGADLNPHSSYLLLGLAVAHYLGGNAKESIEISRRLLDVEPAFSPARILLGFALYIEGSLDEAQKATAAGLQLPAPNPYLYYLDATLLAKQHSRDYAATRLLMATHAYLSAYGYNAYPCILSPIAAPPRWAVECVKSKMLSEQALRSFGFKCLHQRKAAPAEGCSWR